MFKILHFSFLIFLICFTNTTFSLENNIPNIDNITYRGYLSEDTIIDINGINFSNCDDFKINNKTLEIETITERKISYFFGNNNDIKGNLSFKCNNNIASSNFSFPYITHVKGDNPLTDGNIEIKGSNFNNDSIVIFGGGNRLFTDHISSVSIVGKIPEHINSNEFHVITDGLQSNLFSSQILIPTLDYIYSDGGFLIGKKAIIFGKNLNSYNNTRIKIGSNYIDDFKYNNIDGSLTFIIPDGFGNKSIAIISSGITSNSINVDILGEISHIDSAYIRGENIQENLNNVYTEKLIIKGKGFPTSDDDFYLFHNDNRIQVIDISSTEIVIESYNLTNGNNYFYIDSNGTQSNVFNLDNEYDKPYISHIYPLDVDGNNRNFNIGLGNFNSDNDTLYFNDFKITPKSCINSRCRVQLNTDLLKGSFSVGSGNKYKSLPLEFDIEYDKIPVINEIIFNGEIGKGSKFIIKGENFTDSQISFSNLVSQNENERYDISVTNNTIEGRIDYGYNEESQSSIIVQKYGKAVKINFYLNEIDDNIINGVGYINNILSIEENSIITSNSKVQIIGKGFHKDDMILIGGLRTPLIFTNSKLGHFIIPDNIKSGENIIRIENIDGLFSDPFDILINERNFTGEVKIISDLSSAKTYETNTIYKNTNIYSLIVSNKIEDLVVKNLDFKFTNINNNYDLGTFYLNVNGVNIEESLVNDKGILNFSSFLLNKKFLNHEIELIKSSPFIYNGNYNIDVDKMNIFFKGTNKEFKQIDSNGINSKDISIYNKNIVKCFDYLDDNTNCNSYISGSDINKSNSNNSTFEDEIEKEEEDKIKEANINEEKLIEDRLQKAYDRIDTIVFALTEKNNKLSLLDQLNNYKTLRFKINNIITKYNNHKYITFLEYFYNKIDKKYKKVFKEYILSKK